MLAPSTGTRLVALARALKSTVERRTKHFTFILDKNKVVAVGWNALNKTHPQAHKYGYRHACIHSELAAVIKLGAAECRGMTLVNIRITASGQLTISKPCDICSGWLGALKFKRIYYSNRVGEFDQVVL